MVMRSILIATDRKRFGIFEYGKVLFLFLLLSACFATSLHAASPTRDEIITKTQTLQMPFITNTGQMNEQVQFYAKTFSGTVFVTKDGEIVYALPNNGSRRLEGGIQANRESCIMAQASVAPPIGLNGLNQLNGLDATSLFNTFYSYLNTLNVIPRAIALKETVIGAKIGVITGEQPAVTTVNYLKGNDKSKWKTNVPTYNVVNLGEVYKGIELSLKAYGNNVEKLFCVKPGASPEFIQVQLDGGKSLRVNQDGQLEADTDLGTVNFTRPIAYQKIEGKRVEVAVEYMIHGAEAQGRRGEPETRNSKTETANPKLTYGFVVASYDKTKDLIIDPLLASTFVGGSEYDHGVSLALDTSGNVYVTGQTFSTDLPTTNGAYDTTFNGGSYDAFVTKLNGGLTTLLASTYLGGSRHDCALSLTIDASGNVYVSGWTDSTDFPTTNGAYDPSYSGLYQDAFISKLNGELTSLLASTYLGGSIFEDGYSLALDASGNVYVMGTTSSTDFPATNGAYDTSFNGSSDVYVSKLNSGLTTLLASTYLGGTIDDFGKSLAIDASGNVYVTGWTRSPTFPTTSGAYDTSFNGDYDVFISKLDSELTSLSASTFLGGYNTDHGMFLTLDKSGNVYVTGDTWSTSFPTTNGAYDTSLSDGDAFVSKLNSGLTSLLASTFLGGNSIENGASLAIDKSGNVYVTGATASVGFPTTNGAYDTSYNKDTDAFVAKLNSGLTSLLASTFLGGSVFDDGYSLALDTSGNVYVTGVTSSPGFPTTSGAYDTSFNDIYDVFVAKLDGNLSAENASCTYSISPTKKSFTSKSGNGSVVVTASSGGCSWTAASNAAWITVTSGSSGTGNGTVAYSVSANTGKKPRTGTLTIAEKTFTVKQKRGK